MGGSGSSISIDQVVPQHDEHFRLLTPGASVSPRSRAPMPREKPEHRRQARQDVDARPGAPGLPAMDPRFGHRPEPIRQLDLRHARLNAKPGERGFSGDWTWHNCSS